jgi:hypothetical protein
VSGLFFFQTGETHEKKKEKKNKRRFYKKQNFFLVESKNKTFIMQK